jgi:protein O-mannosyl-transferase
MNQPVLSYAGEARPLGTRSNVAALFALGALITLITLGRTATAEFVDWDDNFFLAGNPKLDPPSWHSVLGYALVRNADGNIYIPMTQWVWGVLGAIGRTDQPDSNGSFINPWVFHAANLCVHIASVGVVFAILRRFVAQLPAWIGAVFFAIHPVQVETVAWASEMKDLLAGFFGFIALLQWIRFRERRRRRDWVFATVALTLAMLSKPSAVALPLEALVLDWLLLRTRLRHSFDSLWPWFLLAIPIALIARHLQPPLWQMDNPPLLRPLVAWDTIAFYIAKIIAPVRLIFDYGRTPKEALAHGWRLMWILPLLLAALLMWKGKRIQLVVGGCLLGLATILPMLGLIPFAAQDYSTVSDHYLYPAMLGVAIVAASLFEAAQRRFDGKIVFAFSLAVIAVLAVQSFALAGVWNNSISLFSAELSINPRSSTAHTGMAAALAKSGDFPGAGQHFLLAEQVNPHNGMAIMGLANVLMHQGDLDGAASQFEKLLQVYQMQSNFDPRLAAAAELVVATRLLQRGDSADAIIALEQARAWDPTSPHLDDLLSRARLLASTRPTPAAGPPAHAAF